MILLFIGILFLLIWSNVPQLCSLNYNNEYFVAYTDDCKTPGGCKTYTVFLYSEANAICSIFGMRLTNLTNLF